ncbi:hypothetical protein D3C71_1554950 [compost metagenome]
MLDVAPVAGLRHADGLVAQPPECAGLLQALGDGGIRQHTCLQRVLRQLQQRRAAVVAGRFQQGVPGLRQRRQRLRLLGNVTSDQRQHGLADQFERGQRRAQALPRKG